MSFNHALPTTGNKQLSGISDRFTGHEKLLINQNF
jgi:hypothetical protein